MRKGVREESKIESIIQILEGEDDGRGLELILNVLNKDHDSREEILKAALERAEKPIMGLSKIDLEALADMGIVEDSFIQSLLIESLMEGSCYDSFDF